MINKQNLIPFNKSKLSKEEVRAINRKGGLASAKARKEKANFKKAVEVMLETSNFLILDQQLEKLGISTKDKDLIRKWLDFLQLKLLDKRSKAKDIISFLEFARDSIGQKPKEHQEITSNQPIQIVFSEKCKNL